MWGCLKSSEPKISRILSRLSIFSIFALTISLGFTQALAQTGKTGKVPGVTVRVVGLIVNSTEIHGDTNPGDGVCDTGDRNKFGDRVCTLSAAITEANKRKGKDRIELYWLSDYYKNTEIYSIKLDSALPAITDPVDIVACSPTSSGCLPNVELSGALSSASYGLKITGGNSTIEGLIINRIKGVGILLTGKGGNNIKGNYIGIDHTGKLPAENTKGGIVIDNSDNNKIGGAADADKNIISGNRVAGVIIKGSRSRNNTVTGNYIGTNIDGDCIVGSDGKCKIDPSVGKVGNLVGVLILGAVDNTIGGGNLISGNVKSGVLISGPGSKGNVVEGNFIGTDITGNEGIHNGTNGIELQNAVENTIGGIGEKKKNVISGNIAHGILIKGTNSKGNKIIGNVIGTRLSGYHAVPNNGDGVHIINAGNNFVGGVEEGEDNMISSNKGNGIYITGVNSKQNRIQGNFIGTGRFGLSPLPNEKNGVHIENAGNNFIGGVEEGAGNVISGNKGSGIYITGETSRLNRIQGNFIGTEEDGLMPNPNEKDGVHIENSPENIIGGTAPNSANVISCNNLTGVVIKGAKASGNKIQGNRIGTNKDGTGLIITGEICNRWGCKPTTGNLYGLAIDGAPGNIIARNVISGNSRRGVGISGGGAKQNRIEGNFIGVDIKGTKALPNDAGIEILMGMGEDNADPMSEIPSNNYIGGTVKGLGNVISGNRFQGVKIEGSSFCNKVEGNKIGTDKTGKRKISNGVGIEIEHSDNNTIGGASANAGNVISGNEAQGITISGFSERNSVVGNLIGTDVSGTKALGNKIGLELFGDNSIIGGVTLNSGNVISGNEAQGILITHKAKDNRILGNFIGTDKSGTSKLGNEVGIFIADSLNNTIGGSSKDAANIISKNKAKCGWKSAKSRENKMLGNKKGAGNVISGNRADGILIKNSDVIIIQSNLIGTDVTEQKSLGNGGRGISITESNNNIIGSDPASSARERIAQRNTIANNKTDGVYIENSGQNTIRSNKIYNNGNSGITLRSANANNPSKAPILISANRSVVRGEFIIQPFSDFTIEYFSTPSCNGSRVQGKRPLGTLTVLPKQYGGFGFRPRISLKSGHFISATATDPKGNTSEFSNCVKVK